MPREQGAGPNNTNDTSNTGDTGGTGERGDTNRLTDWQRIDAEKPQRDALSRKWDAENDPTPEFENAARPLPPDHGSHRPKHLELSEAQKEELEATYDRPIDQLLPYATTTPAPATTATNTAPSSPRTAHRDTSSTNSCGRQPHSS